MACPGVKTLGGQLFNRVRRLFLRGISVSNRQNPREHNGHWGKKGKSLKAEKTISHKTTSQQQLVSSLLSELRCVRFVNTIVQSKFDEE